MLWYACRAREKGRRKRSSGVTGPGRGLWVETWFPDWLNEKPVNRPQPGASNVPPVAKDDCGIPHHRRNSSKSFTSKSFTTCLFCLEELSCVLNVVRVSLCFGDFIHSRGFNSTMCQQQFSMCPSYPVFSKHQTHVSCGLSQTS